MSRITEGKVVIFSAPSGAGKSTIIGRLLEKFPRLEFSISCTSRPPRGKEVHGREYYFLSNDEFKARAGAGEFVEWEEVYPGTCYGTLRSEVDRIWEKGSVIVFDVDVKGGVNLKKTFGASALSVFIMPPSVEELRRRLVFEQHVFTGGAGAHTVRLLPALGLSEAQADEFVARLKALLEGFH